MSSSQVAAALPSHEPTVHPQCTARHRQCTPSAPAMQHATDRATGVR
jgi:hypothetical protein